MGLDQYAYIETDHEQREPDFYWRKHSRLQAWAESLFVAKTGGSAHDLNCGELQLNRADIEGLETLLAAGNLPKSEGGFFFGHQFQDEQAEEYAEQDGQFCAWAKDMIAQGETVIYSCWW